MRGASDLDNVQGDTQISANACMAAFEVAVCHRLISGMISFAPDLFRPQMVTGLGLAIFGHVMESLYAILCDESP